MHRNIIILGLVSFFTDISSEMIYPLIPLYLTTVLGASPAILGIVEGIAESLASLLKIYSGRIFDRLKQRKMLTIAGYGLSAVGKVLFVIATSWAGVLAARINDRFGKGIRTAPRDALIAESSEGNNRGKAFGLHRAMDTAGAVLGIVLAYWLFNHYQGDYLAIFWLSVIPAAIGVLCLLFIRETRQDGAVVIIQKAVFSWRLLDQRLRYFIIVSFLFNIGNSSNTFLLLRAGTSGFAPGQVILLYLLMNFTYFLVAYPAGRLSDRIGRGPILGLGYLFYGLVYLGFAAAHTTGIFVGLFGLYGIYSGLTEGIEKALLADMAPVDQKATVYGLHAMAVGFALLPASAIAGLLWTYFGAQVPFYFSGGLGILAAIAIPWVLSLKVDNTIV